VRDVETLYGAGRGVQGEGLAERSEGGFVGGNEWLVAFKFTGFSQGFFQGKDDVAKFIGNNLTNPLNTLMLIAKVCGMENSSETINFSIKIFNKIYGA
jgi:hypothetical protein